MKKYCKYCKWFEVVHPSVMRRPQCLYPMPFWVGEFMPDEDAGEHCKTFEPQPPPEARP